MTGQLKLPNHRNFKWLTVITVTALVIGFAIGLIANSNLTPAFETLYLILKPVEQGWMLAIRVVGQLRQSLHVLEYSTRI